MHYYRKVFKRFYMPFENYYIEINHFYFYNLFHKLLQVPSSSGKFKMIKKFFLLVKQLKKKLL